ncbi:MAG: hypothetical protein ACOX32_07215 [Bacteroidaceae bacterium]|jgi:hypothetical protein|nr:hypothetical protein [Bacteroidaceae bacterium]OPZ48466.1 MAG: hypothetical protein BWY95_00803 [Bacteroidetes bacterium ADurb.BinA104]HBA13495.1 hypothetical protein [Bacteroidales bacterium]MBP8602411.1 hypothetical protein [Bacteroidaceae bacterium]HOD68362.1 hypothetical protein [Bacteroidaceae bacterium]
MKKIIIPVVISLCALTFTGCDPMEPSTYSERLFRIGTVNADETKVWLSIDKTGQFEETVYLSNFNLPSHLGKFNVTDGDRVIAVMDFKAVGYMDNNSVELRSLEKIPVISMEDQKPADSLNYYYQFTKMMLGSTSYPAIWNTGHIVNICPIYFIPQNARKPEFYMYPVGVASDTLLVRIYSYIPDADVSLNPDFTQTILCCDISTLTAPVADSAEQAHRNRLLTSLRTLETDHIYVKMITPDSLRAKNSKNQNNPEFKLPIPGLSQTVQIPFDF